MSRDLVFGRTRRDWSVGIDLAPRPAVPLEPTAESRLEALIAAKKPQKPSRSAEAMVKDALREGSPEGMALYEKYRPTFRDHQVVLRMKADPFKG